MTDTVRDNTERQRFELEADGHIAFANYKRADGVLTMLHTEVPKELEGCGIGSALIRGVFDTARREGLKVNPLCPFAKAYIDKHPEYADLRMTFLCASGTASFRSASRASEPGIPTWPACVVLDSGLRPAADPGMTRRAKRAQNSLFQVHLTQSLLFDKTLAPDPGVVYSRLCASPAFAHVDCVPRRARAHLRQPRASSGASLGQSEALQQELRFLPCAVGLDVRHALCAGEDARAPHLRLPPASRMRTL
jgi:uncharacterized protein